MCNYISKLHVHSYAEPTQFRVHVDNHVHVHVHCIAISLQLVHVQTVTQYLGQFIGECDEEFAISLSLVWRESENTCHIVTLWTLLLL